MDNEPENTFLDRHQKRVISELRKGKKLATQLQTLLHNHHAAAGVSHLVPELTLQIFRSFTEALFLLNNDNSGAGANISADSGDRKWEDSGRSGKKTAEKARRGCYKRKSSETWMNVSNTKEDGGAWRKYGQKRILNSKYPRCYFRCTHKPSQGCKARKQVQRMSEDEYRTIYFGQHTCKGFLRSPMVVTKSKSVNQEEECSKNELDTQGGVSDAKSLDSNMWDNGQSLTTSNLSGDKALSSSGHNHLDIDYSCFANLDNLFQLEEKEFFSD